MSISMSARRGGNYAALVFCLSLVFAVVGLGSCGGDGTEDEPNPIATERCNPADPTAEANGIPGDEADEPGGELGSGQAGCKQAKQCKPAGRTCKPTNAAQCCSLTCLCPVGAKKCTCG